MFESAADKHINDLIEHLCDKASRIFCEDDERQSIIEQIAKLRASQNPIINMTR